MRKKEFALSSIKRNVVPRGSGRTSRYRSKNNIVKFHRLQLLSFYVYNLSLCLIPIMNNFFIWKSIAKFACLLEKMYLLSAIPPYCIQLLKFYLLCDIWIIIYLFFFFRFFSLPGSIFNDFLYQEKSFFERIYTNNKCTLFHTSGLVYTVHVFV